MPTATKENEHKGAPASDAPAGPPNIVPKGKVTIKDAEPEGVVIGENGQVSRPTVVTSPVSYDKQGNSEERFAGRVLLEGDTGLGYHYKMVAIIPQALTEVGLFHVFKSHFPDAGAKGFTFKAVDLEETEKLLKEWQAEHEGKKPEKK